MARNFQRIQVRRRLFGVRVGQMLVGVKEYKTRVMPDPAGKGLSFLLTSQGAFRPSFWGTVDRLAVRREILRRLDS